MEITYQRNVNRNYMILEGQAMEETYEESMLAENHIKALLYHSCQWKNPVLVRYHRIALPKGFCQPGGRGDQNDLPDHRLSGNCFG